jgi:bisphosphoglycerate-dependent phosphoglycerate mutase
MKRAMVLYEEKMKTDIRMGKNVLVAAHANSLRGLIKHLEQLDENDISDVSIPNGIPLVYEFDSSMKIITRPNALPPLRGEYLEEKGLFREVLKREKELTAARSRYDPEYTILSILQNSSHSNSSIDQESFEQFDAQLLPQYQQQQQQQQNKLILAAVEYGIGTGLGSDLPLPEKKVDEAKRKKQPQYLVLLRHGKTEHNRLGLFTGWEDVPLIDVGRAEARKAGQILRLHGIEFDVVYTSWLSRSIETAWLVLNEMDSMWLPIVKTWRLNERMVCPLR